MVRGDAVDFAVAHQTNQLTGKPEIGAVFGALVVFLGEASVLIMDNIAARAARSVAYCRRAACLVMGLVCLRRKAAGLIIAA